MLVEYLSKKSFDANKCMHTARSLRAYLKHTELTSRMVKSVRCDMTQTTAKESCRSKISSQMEWLNTGRANGIRGESLRGLEGTNLRMYSKFPLCCLSVCCVNGKIV